MKRSRLAAAVGVALASAAIGSALVAQQGRSARAPLILAESGYFFVGGQYVKTKDGEVMDGQMYVHAWVPDPVIQPYPIVMIHGNGQTGTNFEGTPDGREGWAQYFVRAGYAVYVVDQPARGRSAYHPDRDGELTRPAFGNALGMAQAFTATATANQWPRARLHTQWPGDGPRRGQQGDPVFDQFFASQVESIPTLASESLVRAAGAALLDKLGPSILLTHSQSVAFGWQIADARPAMVRAIVAIEPGRLATPIVAPDGSMTPQYGLTAATPLTFDPPLTDASQLVKQPQTEPDAADLTRCWAQGDPVRQLPTLKRARIMIIAAQASSFAQSAHCVSKYLTQAGVANEFIRLENVGIFGNGHMLMLERNSDQIARFLDNWLKAKA